MRQHSNSPTTPPPRAPGAGRRAAVLAAAAAVLAACSAAAAYGLQETASAARRAALPAPVITAKPLAATSQRSAVYRFKDARHGVSFLCSLDGAAYAPCRSPLSYGSGASAARCPKGRRARRGRKRTGCKAARAAPALAAGRHTFRVVARNRRGQRSRATTYAWTIEATATSASGGAPGAAAGGPSAGAGTATVPSLGAPTLTTTPGAEAVQLRWEAPTPPGAGEVRYYVTRDGGAPAGSCPSSSSPQATLSCTDESVPLGAHEYTVTAVWGSLAATSEARTAQVTYGPATHLLLEAAAGEVGAGESVHLTVTAKDAANRTVASYAGVHTLTFQGAGSAGSHHPTVTDSAGSAVAFGEATPISFSGGIAGVSGSSNGVATLYRAEDALIEVTDGSLVSNAGAPVAVRPGGAKSLALSSPGSGTGAGAGYDVTITALDEFGNTATTYGGSGGETKTLRFGGAQPAPNGAQPTMVDDAGAAVAFGEPTEATFTNGVAFPGSTATPDSGYVTNGTVLAVAHSSATDTTYIGGEFTEVARASGPGVALGAASGSDLGWARVWGGEARVLASIPDGSGGFFLGGNFTHVGGVAASDLAHVTSSGQVDPAFAPNANGVVDALALAPDGRTLYVGGEFTEVGGQARHRLAAVCVIADCEGSIGAGKATAWNAQVENGAVRALAISGTTVVAAGSFHGAHSVGGASGPERNYLAAFCTAGYGSCTPASGSYGATNTVSAWGPSLNGEVDALAVSGQTGYAGGSFTMVGSTPRRHLAAICLTAGCQGSTPEAAATTWAPEPNNTVYGLALSSSRNTLYVAGSFEFIGKTYGCSLSEEEQCEYTEPDGVTLYCEGQGTCQERRSYLAAVCVEAGCESSLQAGQADAWDPRPNSVARSLALSGETVYAGGAFMAANTESTVRHHVAAFSMSEKYSAGGHEYVGRASAWNPNVIGRAEVRALAVAGATVYAGGAFSGVGGVARTSVAALNASDEVTAWNPNLGFSGGGVTAIQLSAGGSTVYVGGGFTAVNGSTMRNRAAAFSATEEYEYGGGTYVGRATAWNPNLASEPLALALSGETVYVGGQFSGPSSVNGNTERNHLAAFNATTGTVSAWNPNASGAVRALVLSGETLYAGGSFAGASAVNGTTERNHLAAFSTATGTVTAWNPNISGTVDALALSADGFTLYAAGEFAGSGAVNGGVERNRLAALCTAASAACTPASGSYTDTNDVTAWNPDVSGTVNALALSGDGGTVYAGGSFHGANSVNGDAERNAIAAFSSSESYGGGSVGRVSAWNPGPSGASEASIGALAVSGARLYAGGSFPTTEGSDQSDYAAFTIAQMVLYRAETAHLTVSDGTIDNNSAPLAVEVAPAGATEALRLTPSSSTPTAGEADDLTIEALDRYGNLETGYGGEHAYTFEGAAESPAGDRPYVTNGEGAAKHFGEATALRFSNGVSRVEAGTEKNGTMRLYRPETTVLGAGQGGHSASTTVTVGAAGAKSLELSAPSSSVTAGQPDGLTITALDEYGNLATGYTGTKRLTFSGAQAAPDGAQPTVSTEGEGSGVPFGSVTEASFTDGVALPGSTGTADPGYATNGTVQAVAHHGEVTYIGGEFTEVAPATGGGVAIGTSGGSSGKDLDWARLWGSAAKALAAVPDGAGGFYVGGEFTSAGGLESTDLVHVKATGEVDRGFATSVQGGPVEALALSPDGRTLYVGGAFTSIGGETRNRLAAVCVVAGCDGAGTAVGRPTAWNPNVASGRVSTLALSSDGATLYAGGEFHGANVVNGSVERNNLAAFCTSAAEAECKPASGSYSAEDNVSSWNPDAEATVYALAISGQTVYVGGSFGEIDGVSRPALAAVCGVAECEPGLGAGQLTAWNPRAQGLTKGLAVSPDGRTLYETGNGELVGGQTRRYLAALCIVANCDGRGTAAGGATEWNPQLSTPGRSLALSPDGSTIYVGGGFHGANAVNGNTERNYLAAFCTSAAEERCKPASGSYSAEDNVTSWNPDALASAGAEARVLALTGSTIYAGGPFTGLGGVARKHLAALNAANEVTSWNPAPNASVRALAISPDGKTVYAGGGFTTIEGKEGALTRDHLAAICASAGCEAGVGEGRATEWNPNANGIVNSLLLAGGDVYLGGAFTTVDGLTRERLAAVPTTGSEPTAWNPRPNNTVNAIAISGSTLYAGGTFSEVQGKEAMVPRAAIAALCLSAGCEAGVPEGAATEWNPKVEPERSVSALVISGGTVYFGGNFYAVNGLARERAAAQQMSDNTAPTEWNPTLNGPVTALAASGGTIYLGGHFNGSLAVDGAEREFLASVSATGGGRVTAWAPNPSGEVRALLVAGSKLYVGGAFTTMQLGDAAHFASLSIGQMSLYEAGTAHLTVSDGTIASATLAITVLAGEPARLAWSEPALSAGSLGACLFSCTGEGLGSAGTFKARVQITDEWGNPQPSHGSGAKTVTLSKSCTGCSLSTGTLTIPEGSASSSSELLFTGEANTSWEGALEATEALAPYAHATAALKH